MGSKKTLWIAAALVAAIVLPLGSVLLAAGAATRKRTALRNGSEDPYAAWFRLRDELAGRKS
jgi:hypothetical protein